EEERKAAEAKRSEEERKAAEAKRSEEERKAAEAKRIEEERKVAEAKKAAEAKRIEEERKAEEARREELLRPRFYAPKYLFAKDIQHFSEIVDMSRADLIDKLDKAINQAASQNQWHRVKELSMQLKVYDQTKASNWLNTAEKQLAPSVHVSAWLDGQEVSATILTKEKNKTPVHLTGLVPGANYSGDLVYERNGEKFMGKITFKVDWKGEKDYRVILKSPLPSVELPLEGAGSIQLVEVEPGEFMMGEDNGSKDELRHLVKLSRKFWMGRYEITQKQWKAVMENNPSNFKNDDNPVEGITWNEAMKFCEKLNAMVADALPEGYKVSLPTEAQWEFAARGGKLTKYYPYSGSDIIDDVAWHSENSNVRTQPVGLKFPNELGLYDMTGNVWEWCLDACEWENKVLTDTYRDGIVDPLSTKGELHIIRGGGWLSSPKHCRISNRLCCDTNFKIYNLGLRIVLVPKK
ncbi:MAG: SUMF1/EgtB/PvdO family nonheme iron enzyme, partial [Victivallales bacterium]|nr:SUMF1/EgtB/PvdO family nonheme iron enzyme [Victivallales bacterium]